MYDPHAQTLQQHALRALSDLRGWLWAHHGHLLPDDAAQVSREHAQRFAAYLDWFSKIDEALLALDVAGRGGTGQPLLPGSAEPPEPAAAAAPLARKTVRFTEPARCAARDCPPTVRSVTPHATISILAPDTIVPVSGQNAA